MHIGGSLLGGAGGSDGSLYVKHSLGSLTIAGDLVGGIGDVSGSVIAGLAAQGGNPAVVTNIGSVHVNGSLVGGGLYVTGDLGQVTVDHDLFNSKITASGRITGLQVKGGDFNSWTTVGGNLGLVRIAGAFSPGGRITSEATLTGVTIGGDDAGFIGSKLGIGSVHIGANVRDGGVLQTAGPLEQLVVGGSVHRGGLGFTGPVYGTSHAQIAAAGAIGSIQIGRDFFGSIESGAALRSVKIGGSVEGGDNAGSITAAGSIVAGADVTAISIGGSIIGAQGTSAGQDTGVFVHGHLGTLTVGGDLQGGPSSHSGVVSAGAGITSITIGGSLIGGSNPFAVGNGGADVTATGAILTGGDLGSLHIGGSITGGTDNNSSHQLAESGYVSSDGRIGLISVGGSIVTGFAGQQNASIRAGEDIGSLTVKGGLIGNNDVPVLITAKGQKAPLTADVAIGKIMIGGTVLAGEHHGLETIRGLRQPATRRSAP